MKKPGNGRYKDISTKAIDLIDGFVNVEIPHKVSIAAD